MHVWLGYSPSWETKFEVWNEKCISKLRVGHAVSPRESER
jgi:hypothetical protein